MTWPTTENVRRRSLLLLLIALLAAMIVKANDKARPFTRLQSTTGNVVDIHGQQLDHNERQRNQETLDDRKGKERQQAKRKRRLQQAASGFDQPLRPNDKVAFLQKIAKGNVDPIELFTRGVKSKAFQAVLKNVEIQHHILKEMPLLAAFDGFRQITGRRLSARETMEGFAIGVQNVIDFAKVAFIKVKDPQQTAATIAKMAADPNPAIQSLFRRAQEGDPAAVEELQDVFNDLHFPGVDMRVLREVGRNHTFDKLLSMPEIMRFIDRDEFASNFFRSDIKETFFKQDPRIVGTNANGIQIDTAATVGSEVVNVAGGTEEKATMGIVP